MSPHSCSSGPKPWQSKNSCTHGSLGRPAKSHLAPRTLTPPEMGEDTGPAWWSVHCLDASVTQPTLLKGPVSLPQCGDQCPACAGPVSKEPFLIQPVTLGSSRETKAQELRHVNTISVARYTTANLVKMTAASDPG